MVKLKAFLPVIVLFILLNGFLISGKSLLAKWNMNSDVVMTGNLLLFAITLVSFLLAFRGLKSANAHAFMRSVYTSMMFKLFVCIIAAFIYIYSNNGVVNKPALFACMGLYLVYTFLEVSVLTGLLKKK